MVVKMISWPLIRSLMNLNALGKQQGLSEVWWQIYVYLNDEEGSG